MPKYEMTIRTVYVQEIDIEAEDEIEAKKLAMQQFYPDSAYIFSMDVFGFDPWKPIDDREDRLYEQYRQQEIDDEA